MAMNWAVELARPDIRSLAPYEPAAWEPGFARLHANESPWRSAADTSEEGLNRYPEPYPLALAARLAPLYGVPSGCLLAVRGSDEGIDLLLRAYCSAGTHSILICPPTFGMYAVTARIQGASVIEVPLQRDRGFAPDCAAILAALAPHTRLVFLCTPNNPTGNAMAPADILPLAAALAGRALLVIDEAYAEFSARISAITLLDSHPGIVVLRTLSKAHGLAGTRCGLVLAASGIISLLRRIVPPYALTQQTIETVERITEPAIVAATHANIARIRAERTRVAAALGQLPGIRRVWPSEANFLLVEFEDAERALARAHAARLLIRDVRSMPGLGAALRITLGSTAQNDRLLESLA
jgi:histidinol-phosphate aminotransferase